MYQILIDERIFTEDFKKIDNPDQQKIIKAIRNKLTDEPDRYGQPLRGNLKGLWKLRVGQYRVIYEIKKRDIVVYVAKVGFRRNEEVYKEVLKRLK